MTPSEFRAARKSLGLKPSQLAKILNVDSSTVRKWELEPGRSTSRKPDPIACRALEWFLAGYRPSQWPLP